MTGQIIAPYFCAGLSFDARVVIEAAPIIRYMEGWALSRVKSYCRSKKWSFYELDSAEAGVLISE